jgi:hypothetical protein
MFQKWSRNEDEALIAHLKATDLPNTLPAILNQVLTQKAAPKYLSRPPHVLSLDAFLEDADMLDIDNYEFSPTPSTGTPESFFHAVETMDVRELVSPLSHTTEPSMIAAPVARDEISMEYCRTKKSLPPQAHKMRLRSFCFESEPFYQLDWSGKKAQLCGASRVLKHSHRHIR